MNQRYPRIRLQAEYGYLVAREGLQFTFFMRRPREEVVPGVLHSLEAYLRSVGSQAFGWYTDDDGEFWELDEASWEQTRQKLSKVRSPIVLLYDASLTERRYRFEYHGKDLGNSPMGSEIDAACAASFWLPTEFLEQHGPSRVRELALEWASALPFCSGYGGLSLNGELDMVGVAEEAAPYCLRHPGMDVANVHHLSWNLGTRLRGPHWLTFLGQPVLGELGGPSTLRSRLHSPGTTVQEIDRLRSGAHHPRRVA